jgi:hypothetical protein
MINILFYCSNLTIYMASLEVRLYRTQVNNAKKSNDKTVHIKF